MTETSGGAGRWGEFAGRVVKWVGISLLAVVVVYVVGGVTVNAVMHHIAGTNAQEGYDLRQTELATWRASSDESLASMWGEPLATRRQVSCSTPSPRIGDGSSLITAINAG